MLKIEILGATCGRCQAMEECDEQAAQRLGLEALTAIFGGRPGMISAATAATALLMVTLVKEHGLQYLLAARVLTGVFQMIPGAARIAST